ncbi:hypothetical protein AABD41_00060 [Staphylococcus pseudoxylosus]
MTNIIGKLIHLCVIDFLETTHLEPPIEQWAIDGLLTIVDDDVIDISYIGGLYNNKRSIT